MITVIMIMMIPVPLRLPAVAADDAGQEAPCALKAPQKPLARLILK